MLFRKLFKNEKRYDLRIFLDGVNVFLNKKKYYLADLSHTGFAVEGLDRHTSNTEVVSTDFTFTLSSRELMVSCRAKLVWRMKDRAGFEFFDLTPKEKADIAFFIKSHQFHVAAE